MRFKQKFNLSKCHISYFLDSDIKISPIASKANPPGRNLPIKKLVNSIAAPVRQNTTPNLNFHLLCIILFYIKHSFSILSFIFNHHIFAIYITDNHTHLN